MKGEVRLQLFRYYGGQDEHQQEAVLRHEVEGKSGEVCFFMKVYFLSSFLSPVLSLSSLSRQVFICCQAVFQLGVCFALDVIFVFQISLEVGDVLGVAGNHWNGFNKGRNHRNNR